MSRTARLWRGAGFLMLGGVLLSGVSAFGADEPPLSNQLTDLGRQALAKGARPTAETFFQKALELDPTNTAAARGPRKSQAIRASRVVQVALQDPEPGPGAADAGSGRRRPPPAPPPTPRRPSSRPRRLRTSPASS